MSVVEYLYCYAKNKNGACNRFLHVRLYPAYYRTLESKDLRDAHPPVPTS